MAEQSELAAKVNGSVKAELGRHDVTTAQLMEWTGIKSGTTVRSRKNGESDWTLEELDGIARGLGVPVVVMFSVPTT